MVLRARKPKNLGAKFVQRAQLFSLCGRWPLPKAERERLYHSGDKLPAWYGTLEAPVEPPESLTDTQALRAREYLEQRGWTLERNAQGKWGLVRLL